MKPGVLLCLVAFISADPTKLIQKSVTYNNDHITAQTGEWDPDQQDFLDAQLEDKQRLKIEKSIKRDVGFTKVPNTVADLESTAV